MKPFTFPAWTEESPSRFVLQFGPYPAGLAAGKPQVAYKAAATVVAELDVHGPYWRASVPFLDSGDWKHRALPERFASADDAKLAVEQNIRDAGDGRYMAPLPSGVYSIRADGSVQLEGKLLESEPATLERLRALFAEAQQLITETEARTVLNEAIASLRRACTTSSGSASSPDAASTLQ